MLKKSAKIIIFPRRLEINASETILSSCCEAVEHDGPVIFDLGKVAWAAPFGITVLAITLERCLKNKKEVLYTPPGDVGVNKYLKRIGFERMFLEGGEKATLVSTSLELRRLERMDYQCIEDLIQVIAGNFSLKADNLYLLKMSIIEFMTNSFDHSRSKLGLYICAQMYPQLQNIKVSFADGGIGIRESLNQFKKYGFFRKDSDAIKKAVERGVTTRTKSAGGVGLTHVRNRVRKNKGVFAIIGGNSKVSFYYNKIDSKELEKPYSGTLVDISINPDRWIEQTSGAANDYF
ncbi:hypothetical protein ACFL6Y_03950 [Elusimicrobiota bacterium]